MRTTCSLAAAACWVATAHAFTVAPPPCSTSSQRVVFSSALHLVPGQGSQLVAAFHASSSSGTKNNGTDSTATTTITSNNNNLEDQIANTESSKPQSIAVQSAAKGVMNRIFSIPGAILGRHPAAAPAMVDMGGVSSPAFHKHDQDDDDVVLYPICGFRFVPHTNAEDGSVEFRALPPPAGNAACRIPHTADQVVYGWYTPSCPLSQTQVDDENYGKAPPVVVVED